MRLLLAFFLALCASTCPAQDEFRIALVIGIQDYKHTTTLRHSLQDARDMAAMLTAKNFKVDALYNPKTKAEIRAAITRYYNAIKDRSNAVGIIYYAGHGLQHDGENYLVPADASLDIPDDLEAQCVRMNALTSVLQSSTSSLNILILDACRNNPFPAFSRDMAKGLVAVQPPKGSIVVFATQPGSVASDGEGTNGLFTSKLLKYMDQPNLDIGDVFKKVRQDVNADSNGKQSPSVIDNSIGGDFYFSKAEAPVQVISKKTPRMNNLNKDEYAVIDIRLNKASDKARMNDESFRADLDAVMQQIEYKEFKDDTSISPILKMFFLKVAMIEYNYKVAWASAASIMALKADRMRQLLPYALTAKSMVDGFSESDLNEGLLPFEEVINHSYGSLAVFRSYVAQTQEHMAREVATLQAQR